jgi:hypothetical protein
MTTHDSSIEGRSRALFALACILGLAAVGEAQEGKHWSISVVALEAERTESESMA